MDYKTFFSKVDEAADFLKDKINIQPKVLLVLTGGANDFVNSMQNKEIFVSTEIPNFPESKAEGHSGKIIFGNLEGLPIAVMQGRYHYYEGHSPQSVVFPYFVMQKLGIQIVITTNAVGAINKNYKPGEVVVLKDHINMMGINPLIGIAIQRKTDQFTSMTNAYDSSLRELSLDLAKQSGLKLQEGVYLATTGPSYETKAEIGAFRVMGADTVGMSTVFEVIACNFLDLKVLTFNCIANMAADLHTGKMTHAEVLDAIKKAEPKIVGFLKQILKEINKKQILNSNVPAKKSFLRKQESI